MPDIEQTTTQVTPSQDEALSRVYQQPSETVVAAKPVKTVVPPTPPQVKDKFLAKKWQKILFVVILVLVLLGSIMGVVGFYTYSVVQDMKVQANELQTIARGTYDQFKSQNLPATQEGVKAISQKEQTLRQTYNKLAFYKAIPIARNYFADGEHGFNAAEAGLSAGTKSLEAITPYADVLGFSGEGTFTGGTAEDRLKVVLQTLQKITPVLDSIGGDLEKVKTELAAIDPKRYPENVQGKPIRSYVVQAQNVSAGAASALTDFRPVIEQLPAIAGAENGKRKKYFILFMNNNELRPSGGFLTAYSTIYVENGKVTPEKSDDIYELDKKYPKKLPIPEKLGKYLTTEKSWNLRDMNIDPDFHKSMDQFVTEYKKVPGEPKDIDGIIAIDTQVLVDLIKILGPIDVPGYGVFTAENSPKCDCPQVIYALSEIITRPTPFIRQDRKGILGPMMRSLLTKAYSAPKTQWPDLFDHGWKSIQGRHVQMYFFDEKAQQAAETIGAAGRMVKDPKAEDFLAIVDANLGGAKSNLFIDTEVRQEVSAPKNGELTKKVTITYKNNRKADNCNLEAGLLCLNSTLRDWNRVYLPKGAKLTNSQGYKQGTVKQYDEGEFTVIDGEFTLEPLNQAKLILEYTIPYKDTKTYKVKLWKQAGIDVIPMLMDVEGGEEQVQVDKDTLYQAAF
jgi:hypothetical protein